VTLTSDLLTLKCYRDLHLSVLYNYAPIVNLRVIIFLNSLCSILLSIERLGFESVVEYSLSQQYMHSSDMTFVDRINCARSYSLRTTLPTCFKTMW